MPAAAPQHCGHGSPDSSVVIWCTTTAAAHPAPPPRHPLPPGRHPPGTPASKRLGSGPGSRVLLYLTGHGGDEFLKFHDQVGGPADCKGTRLHCGLAFETANVRQHQVAKIAPHSHQTPKPRHAPHAGGAAGSGHCVRRPPDGGGGAVRRAAAAGRHVPGEPLRGRSGVAAPWARRRCSHASPPQQTPWHAVQVQCDAPQLHAPPRMCALLQASTLWSRVTAPNVLAVASSKLGELRWAAWEAARDACLVPPSALYTTCSAVGRKPPAC